MAGDPAIENLNKTLKEIAFSLHKLVKVTEAANENLVTLGKLLQERESNA